MAGEQKHIYHYCAVHKNGVKGEETVIDGIAELTFEIKSMDDYSRFKELVMDGTGINPKTASIYSLTKLG